MPPSGLFVGLATLDVVHVVERAPAPNEKTTALRQDLAAGGPAANAAVTFAVLGGDATLLTALGSHPLAQVIANELAEHGVSIIDAMPAMAQPPAVSLVRVVESTGERSVSSTNAAGIEAIAPAVLAQAVAASAVVLVDGHHIGLALAAVKLARERRVSVLLDAGSWKPQLSRLLPFVDAAICSADFADPASQSTVDGLLDYGLTSVAVTAGAGPIAWTTRGGPPASGTITPAAGWRARHPRRRRRVPRCRCVRARERLSLA